MRKVWLVIRREYLTRVRTKAFFFTTALVPLLLLGYFWLVVVVSTTHADSTLKIAVADEVGGLAPAIASNLKRKLPDGKQDIEVVATLEHADEPALADLRAKVLRGELDAYLVLPSGILSGKAAEFFTRNPGDLTRIGSLRRAVGETVVSRRLSDRGIHVANLEQVTSWSDVRLVKLTRQGETKEGGETLIIGFVVSMLLYGTLITYGVSTMRSVLEEKTTHIVEILVSSLRPVQLLGGKMLGVAAVGLTQYLIWLVCGGVLATYGATMASLMKPAGVSFEFHVPLSLLGYMAVFFLGGYFLYAALYATVGAVVSTEQDAQQMQIPVILPLILSLVLLNVIVRDSNSTTSVVLSMIPFFSPVLMLFRITLQAVPAWQIALSLGLLAGTTLVVVWLSARIYRVGILMYGKRPSLLEVLRWLRYS